MTARLSDLARCPCQCALRALGTPEPEPDELTLRRFLRGRMFGDYVAQQFEARYGVDGIEREREIPWPCGTGHADIFVRERKQLVEVKASASPESLIEGAIAQVKLYLRFDDEATNGGVYIVDPLDLAREDFLPVKLRADDIAEIDRQVKAVERAIGGGELPACSAASPTACRYSGCPFSEVAWADYEPPEPTSLDDPELVTAALGWYRQREYRRGLEQTVDAAKLVEDEARDRLLERGLPEGESVLGGQIRVRRTKVAGRVTARIAAARQAGVWTAADDERFGDYVRVGEPHERLMGTLLDGAELPAAEYDYGEVAPF